MINDKKLKTIARKAAYSEAREEENSVLPSPRRCQWPVAASHSAVLVQGPGRGAWQLRGAETGSVESQSLQDQDRGYRSDLQDEPDIS